MRLMTFPRPVRLVVAFKSKVRLFRNWQYSRSFGAVPYVLTSTYTPVFAGRSLDMSLGCQVTGGDGSSRGPHGGGWEYKSH